MRDADATLSTFTTGLALRLSQRTKEPSSLPVIESFGTLLQVDIAGSTVLAQQIGAKSQSNPADEFAILLNSCFDFIISSIQAFGGEIVDFAGDSVLALWEHAETGDEARHSVIAASSAALEINQRLLSAVRPVNISPIAVHSMISAGPVTVAGIGGFDSDRRLFLTGPAITDLASPSGGDKAGRIGVSAQAWKLARGSLVGRDTFGELFFLDRVADSDTLERKTPLQKAEVSDLTGAQSYVPKNVRRLSEELVEVAAELRTTTTVFCRIKSEQLSDRTGIQKISDAIRSVQEQCNRYHGLLETVRADDKGTTFMVAFGLPPTSLLHRRSMAIGFAHHVFEILEAFGYEPGIGIATGRVFQGPIGVAQRRQFAFIGSSTILGCRLMQLASKEVLCDEATKKLAEMDRAPWDFEERGPYALKGFDQPVPAFASRKNQARRVVEAQRPRIVGRQAEIDLLEEQIAAVAAGGRSLTIIEGEAGVGKTLLVGEAKWRGELAGCKIASGSSDPLTQSTPYSPWRTILSDLVELPDNGADVESEFRKHIARTDIDEALLPLLNDVFNAGIPDTERTRALSGSARAWKTQQFLAELISACAKRLPVIIVLEDVHWIDVPSFDLFALLYERCRHVGIILTRRGTGAPDKRLMRLMNEGARRIELKNLDREATAELMHVHMAARSIPRDLIDTIYNATEGNPFFVEQVLQSHHRHEQQTRSDGAAKPSSLDLMRISVPNTVEMAILQRVDELSPQEQVLLKTASAIGDTFKIDALMHAHSRANPRPETKRNLQALVEGGFLLERGPHPSATFGICHQLMRKVIYDLIPRHQLAQIHGRIARWYEAGCEGPRASFFAQLAHHWLLAGAENKALAYLSRAGAQSLKSGAHTEAGHFFQTALEVADKSDVGRNWRGGNFRLANWEAQLAQSLWSGGALDKAPVHACRALRLIGFRVPNSKAGWLVLATRQWSMLPFPVLMGFARDQGLRRRRQVMESGAMAAIVIAQVAYYTSDAPRMLAGSLLSLRLGSPRMADASVGRSYAYLGYLAGVMRLHKTAGKLFRQAEARSADHGDVMGLAYAHGGEALYHLGFGRWSLAAPAIEASLDACRSIGDPHLTEMALTLRAMLHYFKGDFIQSKEDFAEINKSAKTRLSQHHLAWGVYGRAENLLRLGKARQAGRLIGIAKTLLQGQSDLHSELICHGLDAMAKLQLGNFVDARLAAVSAIDLARTIVPNNFSSLEGYAAPIEALLELRAAEPASESTLKETRRLKEAFKSLTNYARLFPIGRPRLWYLRGLRSQVSGDPRRTTKHWLRSLNWAHDLDMRYEEYRACEALLHFGSLAPAELRHIEARAGQLSAEGGYRPNRIGNLH